MQVFTLSLPLSRRFAQNHEPALQLEDLTMLYGEIFASENRPEVGFRCKPTGPYSNELLL
jgi:hypothetical protein